MWDLSRASFSSIAVTIHAWREGGDAAFPRSIPHRVDIFYHVGIQPQLHEHRLGVARGSLGAAALATLPPLLIRLSTSCSSGRAGESAGAGLLACR